MPLFADDASTLEWYVTKDDIDIDLPIPGDKVFGHPVVPMQIYSCCRPQKITCFPIFDSSVRAHAAAVRHLLQQDTGCIPFRRFRRHGSFAALLSSLGCSCVLLAPIRDFCCLAGPARPKRVDSAPCCCFQRQRTSRPSADRQRRRPRHHR